MMSGDMLLAKRWRLATTDAHRGPTEDVALLSEGLLACIDAPLLTIELSGDRMWPTLAWNDRLAPCPARTAALHATPILMPGVRALHAAAADLARNAAMFVLPGRPLCVITDGTGVALIEAQPGGDAGWLLAMAEDESTLVLRPFAAESLWAMLQSVPNPCRNGSEACEGWKFLG